MRHISVVVLFVLTVSFPITLAFNGTDTSVFYFNCSRSHQRFLFFYVDNFSPWLIWNSHHSVWSQFYGKCWRVHCTHNSHWNLVQCCPIYIYVYIYIFFFTLTFWHSSSTLVLIGSFMTTRGSELGSVSESDAPVDSEQLDNFNKQLFFFWQKKIFLNYKFNISSYFTFSYQFNCNLYFEYINL